MMPTKSAQASDENHKERMEPAGTNGRKGSKLRESFDARSLSPELSAANDDSLEVGLHSEKKGFRLVASTAMDSISDFINDNLVAARYGTIATITLLSAYGVSKTPLFFRFKTVSQIPGSYFSERRTLHGRLVRVLGNKQVLDFGKEKSEEPIICLIRHLSPFGRILSRSAFDFLLQASPATSAGKQLEDNESDLLKVEIAGVSAPPFYMSPPNGDQPGDWLRRLAEQRTPVACQLLVRRANYTERANLTKRDASIALPELRESIEDSKIDAEDQLAVCKLGYRPRMQLFRTDLASSLVRYGHASVSTSLYHKDETRKTIDSSTNVSDLTRDVDYLDKMAKNEYVAAAENLGMWADSRVRMEHKDIVDEAEFQANASIFERVWRRIRQ